MNKAYFYHHLRGCRDFAHQKVYYMHHIYRGEHSIQQYIALKEVEISPAQYSFKN